MQVHLLLFGSEEDEVPHVEHRLPGDHFFGQDAGGTDALRTLVICRVTECTVKVFDHCW